MQWFVRPLGDSGHGAFLGVGRPPRPALDYVCRRCGTPLPPCVKCGLPAICGDAWCEFCQPDDS